MPHAKQSGANYDDDQETERREEEGGQWRWVTLRQRLEFYVFLAMGGGIWYWLVIKVLNNHNFPYHLYPVEVIFIIWGPIALLALLLGILDRTVKWKQD